jgi:hypothetical protein
MTAAEADKSRGRDMAASSHVRRIDARAPWGDQVDWR